MSDTKRIVQMALINPGETADDGDFTFSMQPRFNPGRTVQFALVPSEAETLYKTLGEFLKEARKSA